MSGFGEADRMRGLDAAAGSGTTVNEEGGRVHYRASMSSEPPLICVLCGCGPARAGWASSKRQRPALVPARLDFLSMGQFGNGRGVGVRQVR